MANTNAPFGFRFTALNGGSAAPTDAQIPVWLAYNQSAIYYGDPVKMQADGTIAPWTSGTAVSQLWGIFSGWEGTGTNGSHARGIYWPGSGTSGAGTANVQAYIIPCILSPAPQFVVQTDSTGITQAAIGANVDVQMGTGSTTTGISGAYLDATFTTTATLPFRVVSLWSDVAVGPGTASGAYTWAVVAANVTGSTGI